MLKAYHAIVHKSSILRRFFEFCIFNPTFFVYLCNIAGEMGAGRMEIEA